jgi:hypothetical protein
MTEPSEAAQEEFYALYSDYAEANAATSRVRTVHLVGESEAEAFWAGANPEVLEHLVVEVSPSAAARAQSEEHGERVRVAHSKEHAALLAMGPDARREHNERAVNVARLLTAQHKLDALMARPENEGRAFRIFSGSGC